MILDKLRKTPILFLLTFIVVLAFGIRFYNLDKKPPGFTWDEAAVGYNAWTMAHWGKDEWGNTFPLVFKSFEDYKHPLHVYLTVPSVVVFGLTEFAVRAPAAIFGVLNVILIFFLAREITDDERVGLTASFVLAVSPYNLTFSRFNHELNFVMFFFMLGLFLLLRGINRRNSLIMWGYGFLGLTLLGYHSAKVVVPAVVVGVSVLYFRELWSARKYFLRGVLAFFFFVALLFVEPNLLGTARIAQNTANDLTPDVLVQNYLTHYSSKFLFETGDPNPRHSTQSVGIMYGFELVFMVAAMFALLLHMRKDNRKGYLLLLFWVLVAPIPAIISTEVPHAARAMFLTGSIHILSALGIVFLAETVEFKRVNVLIYGTFALAYVSAFAGFFNGYLKEYSYEYAIEWQYGMRDIVEFVNDHPEYYKVYMTAVRQQPYIFYLFYGKVPLPEFLSTVRYNETRERSANTVSAFGKFQFGGWDTVESFPTPEILYIVQPANFTGLRHISMFDVKKLVRYPNGADAFFLVSGRIE